MNAYIHNNKQLNIVSQKVFTYTNNYNANQLLGHIVGLIAFIIKRIESERKKGFEKEIFN